ncbi:MAG: DUF1738 domain-containing protein [Proteobacteria bacterium]|nr:DUF1738 domain-containing protein [Pseudomonadota bacterium]
MRKDIYESVTNKIITQIEKGTRPWLQPWASGQHHLGSIHRPLRGNGKPYTGINVVMLWGAAHDNGYSCPMWLTFKQAADLGAHVRKGSKGQTVVYASKFTKEETNARGEDVTRSIPFLKQYTVFNVEQIDGLPDSYYAKPVAVNPAARIANAESFFRNCGATLNHGGNRAFYAPSVDAITMPAFEAFTDAESYYATLAHEHIHWTKHEKRLNRDLGGKRFGDNGYAAEELVAELGAAFVAADLGLYLEPREDHASYLKAWLGILKADSRAIFTAASHAQKAADYLGRLQGHIETDLQEAA